MTKYSVKDYVDIGANIGFVFLESPSAMVSR